MRCSAFLCALVVCSFGCLLSSELADRYVFTGTESWRHLAGSRLNPSVMSLRGGTADLSPADEVMADLNLADHACRSNKLCEEGWALYGEGEMLEAERLFLAALRENPANSEACSKLALLNEFEKGDLEKAEELYRKVRALEPSKCSAASAMIPCICVLTMFERSMQMMSRICTTSPFSSRRVLHRAYTQAVQPWLMRSCTRNYSETGVCEKQERKKDLEGAQREYETALALRSFLLPLQTVRRSIPQI